jgi:cytochrome c-type biogenesis protein
VDGFWTGALSALWLGILTSISPCPLATNIAAISFIGKRVDRSRRILLTGISYTCGRMIAYILMAIVVVAGLLSIPGAAKFLQRYMNKALGPVLILTGLFLLGVIRFNLAASISGEAAVKQAEKGGIFSAGLLGILFSLSLCPTSAALFFGSLIPLSIKFSSKVIFPSLYGIGSGLPVVAVAFVLAFGMKSTGAFFNRLTIFELWARRITGGIFCLIGAYLAWIYWR